MFQDDDADVIEVLDDHQNDQKPKFPEWIQKAGDIGPTVTKSDVYSFVDLNENFSDARCHFEGRYKI